MATFSKNYQACTVTQGEPFTVDSLDRTYGKRRVRAFTIADGLGTNPIGTIEIGAGHVPVAAATAYLTGIITGHNGAFSIVLTGAKVGDKVMSVQDVKAGGTNLSTSFESTISVAGHIEQTAATDLSADTQLLVLIAQQS